MGLRGIRERVERINAHLDIRSEPGKGTVLTVKVLMLKGLEAEMSDVIKVLLVDDHDIVRIGVRSFWVVLMISRLSAKPLTVRKPWK